MSQAVQLEVLNSDGTHTPVNSTTPLPVTSSGAISGVVAQASTTSGQTGVLTQGAVTTASPTYTTAQTDPLSLDIHGGLRALVMDSSGNPLDYTVPALIQGPTSSSRIISAAASTNATSAKASAGRLFNLIGQNVAASARYLKLYNKASAPTVGTDTPVATIYLPASTAFALDFPNGFYFATGLAYALTTGSADADTGALTAGDILGLNVLYN